MRWATLAIRPAGGDEEAAAAGTTESESRRRIRVPGPALQGLLAFLIYLGVFIWAFGSAVIAHLNVPVVGQSSVDPNFYIWAWRWWPYAVTHWTNPLYTNQLMAPQGVNLAWATTSPTAALFMWPVTAVWGAIVSFNLTLLLAPPASAWAAFVATRRLTGKFWAALPAGVIYGFNVYTIDHEISGQPNLSVNLLLPLMVYLAVLWWQGSLRRVGYVIWMMIAFALEFYTFLEAFAQMTLVFAVAFLIGFAVAGREYRLKVARLAGWTTLAYLGGIVLASPYLRYALQNYPTSLVRGQDHFSMDMSGLILPRDDRVWGPAWLHTASGHDIAASTYLGVPLLLMLILLAILSWRNRLVRLLAILFIVIIALAAGPNLIVDGNHLFTLPWGNLWTLPFFRSAEPVRLILFGYLLFSIVIALWLAQVTKSWLSRTLKWGLAVLGLAVIFADLPTFASVVTPYTPNYKQAIPALPQNDAVPSFFSAGIYKNYISQGETVVILSHRGNAGMMFQADTNFYFRIAGGFINASLSRPDALPLPIASMSHITKIRAAQFETYVRRSGIGAIIVEHSWSEKWMYVFDEIGVKGINIGGVTVYQFNHARFDG